MYSRVKFFKTSGCFLFQEDDRFYLSRSERVLNELKELGLVSRKAKKEVIEGELGTIRKGELGVDLRLIGTAIGNWGTFLKTGKCVVNEVGEKMLSRQGEQVRIETAWSNPQNIYKEIMSGVETYISPTAKILPGAVVVGNSYVGHGCIIGNNALVRNSYVDNGAVIGYNTEVSASYIGRKTTLHTNFIGNSVIGDNCHFGYIACTTSLRLDGKNVMVKQENNRGFDTGVGKAGSFVEANCSFGAYVLLMPGSFVGRGSIIRPYTLIKGFVPRNSYCRSVLKTEISTELKDRNVEERYSQLEKRLRVEIENNYRGRSRL